MQQIFIKTLRDKTLQDAILLKDRTLLVYMKAEYTKDVK